MAGEQQRLVVGGHQAEQPILLLLDRGAARAVVVPPGVTGGQRVVLEEEHRLGRVGGQQVLHRLDLRLGRHERLATGTASEEVAREGPTLGVVVRRLIQEGVEVRHDHAAVLRLERDRPFGAGRVDLAVGEVGGQCRGLAVRLTGERGRVLVREVAGHRVARAVRPELRVPVVVAEAGDEGDALVVEALPDRHVGGDRRVTVGADVAAEHDERRVDAIATAVVREVGDLRGLVGRKVVDVRGDLGIGVAAHAGLGVADEHHGERVVAGRHRGRAAGHRRRTRCAAGIGRARSRQRHRRRDRNHHRGAATRATCPKPSAVPHGLRPFRVVQRIPIRVAGSPRTGRRQPCRGDPSNPTDP